MNIQSPNIESGFLTPNDLGVVYIKTDHASERVRVRVYFDRGASALTCILDGEYTAHSSLVTIYELDALTRDIIEAYRPDAGELNDVTWTLNIQAETITEFEEYYQTLQESYNILPCTYAGLTRGTLYSTPQWFTRSFLLTTAAKLQPTTGVINLAYVARGDAEPSAKLEYIKSDGSKGTRTITPVYDTSADEGVLTVDLSTLAQGVTADTSQWAVLTITLGDRRARYYFFPRRSTITVTYLNAFNAYETATLQGTVTKKLSVDRSNTLIGGRYASYDLNHKITYEFQSAPLLPVEEPLAQALLSSPYITLAGGGEIVLTNSKCELNEADDQVRKFSFEFSFTDPRLRIDTTNDITPVNDRIFTEQFTTEFA